MLSLKNISKKFNNNNVLKDVSFEVFPGDFVIIMGPNGTGKSTLFDIISGKTSPDTGRILIDNIDITQMPERKRTRYIGRLFQNTYLGSCSNLTVRENLSLSALKDRKAGIKLGVDAFPERKMVEFLKPLNLNLENFLDVPMGALSGGQRQIISFMMSIHKPPKVLLLDEPTAALDPKTSTQLLVFARDFAIKLGIPTLLITHDSMIAKHLGNRLWVLEEGIIKREFGLEKESMNPHEFFHALDYKCLI